MDRVKQQLARLAGGADQLVGRPWFLPVVTLLFLCFMIFVWWRLGTWYMPDSNDYDAWAEVLLAYDFNYFKAVELIPFYVPMTFYSVFVTIAAVAKIFFSEQWGVAVVVLNILFVTAIVASYLRLIRYVSVSWMGIIVAAALTFLSWDMYFWAHCVSSDQTGDFFTFMVFLSCASALMNLGRRMEPLFWALAIISTTFAIGARPTGIAVVLAFTCFSLISRFVWAKGIPAIGRLQLIAAIGAVTAIVILMIQAMVFANLDDIHMLKEVQILRDLREYALNGEVVRGRLSYRHEPVEGALDLFVLLASKLGYFFAFTAKEFSPAHNVLNIIAHVPLYAFAATAIFNGLFRPERLTREVLICCYLGGAFIFMFATLHAVTTVDYDWRYRSPTYPVLIVLAAIGADYLLARLTGTETTAKKEK